MNRNIEKKSNYSHIKNKYKLDQILEDKFTEIERENRILLEKMHKIMRKHEKPKIPHEKSSLNNTNQRKHYEKINQENKGIYQRLVNKQSVYSHKKYATERKVVENRLAMISNFNKSLKATTRHRKRLSEDVLDLKYLVFKQSLKIRNKSFLIEVYRYPQDVKIIAFDSNTSDIFRLVLSVREALEFIGEFEDYSELINFLDVEGESLTLSYNG